MQASVTIYVNENCGTVSPLLFGHLANPAGLTDPDAQALRAVRAPLIAWPDCRSPSEIASSLARIRAELNAEILLRCHVARRCGPQASDEAAAWVRSCNTATGPDAELRARAGHAQPFDALLWGLEYGDRPRRLRASYPQAREYARCAERYAAAMREADPRLRFVLDGGDVHWNRAVLSHGLVRGAEWISYRDAYDPADQEERLAHEEATQHLADVEAELDLLISVNHHASARAGRIGPIRLAVDGWGYSGAAADGRHARPAAHQCDLAHALYGAGFLNILLRHAGDVTLACHRLPGTCAADGHHPAGLHIFAMYRECANAEVVIAATRSPRLGRSEAPALDVVAARSPDGDLRLCAVNRHPTEPANCEIILDGGSASSGQMQVLTEASLAAHNDLGSPKTAIAQGRKVQAVGERFVTRLEPRSVSMLTVRLR